MRGAEFLVELAIKFSQYFCWNLWSVHKLFIGCGCAVMHQGRPSRKPPDERGRRTRSRMRIREKSEGRCRSPGPGGMAALLSVLFGEKHTEFRALVHFARDGDPAAMGFDDGFHQA